MSGKQDLINILLINTTISIVANRSGPTIVRTKSSDIVDPASSAKLTKHEMQTTIMGIQEDEMVDKDKFISTMMDFFPKYDIDIYKKRLEKLFDWLDQPDLL